MDGYVLLGLVALVAAVIVGSKQKAVDGLEDDPVDADKIRMGVKNGWYNCQLTIINGQPAVRLSGRTTDGNSVVDYFFITQDDWNALKAEGYTVVEYEE